MLAGDFQHLYGLDLLDVFTAPGGFPRFWRLLNGLPFRAQFWAVIQGELGREAKTAKPVTGPLGPGEFTPIEDLASAWMVNQG